MLLSLSLFVSVSLCLSLSVSLCFGLSLSGSPCEVSFEYVRSRELSALSGPCCTGFEDAECRFGRDASSGLLVPERALQALEGM